jgi:hypothetical protein
LKTTGNDGADLLAVAGAASHYVSSEVVTSSKKRRELAKRTQQMMVSILLERQRQERSFQEEGPDRGSDAGDCAVDLEDCMEFVEGGLYSVTKESLCTVHDLGSGNECESFVQNSMMI